MVALEQSHNEFLFNVWSNEQSQERKRFFALGILGSAVTLYDKIGLGEWLPRFEAVLDKEIIEEAVLQTHLFAGYPKTIEALKQVRKYYPQPNSEKQVDDHWESGLATSKLVYGKHHSKLIDAMDKLHPDLTRWMIEDGYGRVLSRPGMSLQEREIAALASLMASGMVNQFRAHLRGAVFAEINIDDIIWFTNTFQVIIAPDMKEAFQKVINQVLANVQSALNREERPSTSLRTGSGC
jgi:4-carboxymuconolactone decarboxylase